MNIEIPDGSKLCTRISSQQPVYKPFTFFFTNFILKSCFFVTEYVWHTDLDFLISHKNRSVVLSFVPPSNNVSAAATILTAIAQKPPKPGAMALTSANVTHTVMKTLKDIIGHDTRSYEVKDLGEFYFKDTQKTVVFN